jgi:hypothetical protein
MLIPEKPINTFLEVMLIFLASAVVETYLMEVYAIVGFFYFYRVIISFFFQLNGC